MSHNPVLLTPEQSWELFGTQHLHRLELRARTVSAQTGVDDRELLARTLDILARKWAAIWVTPVDDPAEPPDFVAELAYARRVMARQFNSMALARQRMSREPPSESELDFQFEARPRQECQNPEMILIQKEQENRIYKLYQALSENQRKVFVMRTTLDMEPSEVAQELELTLDQVSQFWTRARHNLRVLALREGLR